MKKRPQFATAFQRTSFVKMLVFDVFFALSSWPRLVLEVFIRSNFGLRYFSFTHVITVFCLLILTPILLVYGPWNYYTPRIWQFVLNYWSWFLFTFAFLITGWRRNKEVKRAADECARFTFSTGDIHPFFYKLRINGERFDSRTIETLIEPGFFFIAGLLLCLIKQPIGFVILPCSIIYAISYAAAFSYGDSQLYDLSDKWIVSQEMPNFLLNETSHGDSRGFRPYTNRPADPDFARQAAESFADDEDIVDAL